MTLAQVDHFAHKTQEAGILVGQRPIDPAHLVVLAPGVVVAALRTQKLVAGQKHRHALRQQQGGEEVTSLALTQSEDSAIGRRPFNTTVPAVILVRTIALVFTVRSIVLVLVGDQIAESETIVTGDKIDRMMRRTPRA